MGRSASSDSVEEKKKKIKELNNLTRKLTADVAEFEIETASSLYDGYRTGQYRNLDRMRGRWVAPGSKWDGPDLFEFIPKKQDAFQFVPPGGDPIVPRNMITDVGSIPRAFGLFFRGLSPWGYAPAYLVHDWEFELHHCNRTPKNFDEVRDTMMQGVKTLMEQKLAPKNVHDFWRLYT